MEGAVMPQLIAYPATLAVTAAVAMGATGAVASFVGGVTLAVTKFAVSAGLSYVAASLLKGKAPTVPPTAVQQTLNQYIGPRVRHYVTVNVGGIRAFYDSKDGKLYELIVTGHGRIDSVVEHRLNDKPVELDLDGFVTTEKWDFDGEKRVRILHRLGTDAQAHMPELEAEFPEWDPSHRLLGLNYSLCGYTDVKPEAF